MRATDHKNHNESFTQHHPAFETLLHDTDWHRQFIVQDRLQKKEFDANFIPFYLSNSSAQRHHRRTESFCARYCMRVRKTACPKNSWEWEREAPKRETVYIRDLWNATWMLRKELPLWVTNSELPNYLDLLPKDWSRTQLKQASPRKHPKNFYTITENFHTPNPQPSQPWGLRNKKRNRGADFALLESWVSPLAREIKLLFPVLEDKASGFRNRGTFSYGKSCQQLRHKNCSSQACGQS